MIGTSHRAGRWPAGGDGKCCWLLVARDSGPKTLRGAFLSFDEDLMVSQSEPNFHGKVVVAYLRSEGAFGGQNGWTLESPYLEEQLGRTFLVGKPIARPQDPPPWYEGATLHIPWESISHYLVYESVEACRRAMSRHGDQPPGNAGWFGRRGKD
jgi:hypothetical protein